MPSPFAETSGTNPDAIYDLNVFRRPAWGLSWGVSWGNAWGTLGDTITIYAETSGPSIEEIYEEN